MDRQERLRIAVQKSGRLTDESLDLLHRCGLKFSRGKDQLMCYGENMPLDVLFVRDDDIPDLVQEDVCDLGLVGMNVLEEKRLAMLARGTSPAHRDPAEARLRPLPPVARRAGRLRLRGPAEHRGQAHRHDLSARAGALPARERHHGRDRHAVRRGRDRAAPRPGRPDLRPRLHRLDPDGESPARSRRRAREPGGAGAHADRPARHQGRLGPPPAGAHRRRAAGPREQVHHAARAALGAAADRATAAGQRVTRP